MSETPKNKEKLIKEHDAIILLKSILDKIYIIESNKEDVTPTQFNDIQKTIGEEIRDLETEIKNMKNKIGIIN